jgi:hypothetical protein
MRNDEFDGKKFDSSLKYSSFNQRVNSKIQQRTAHSQAMMRISEEDFR